MVIIAIKFLDRFLRAGRNAVMEYSVFVKTFDVLNSKFEIPNSKPVIYSDNFVLYYG